MTAIDMERSQSEVKSSQGIPYIALSSEFRYRVDVSHYLSHGHPVEVIPTDLF